MTRRESTSVRDDGGAADQRSAARAATIAALFVVAAFVASKVARDAIWLANFDVTSLPMFVGVSAILAFPVALLTGRVMSRTGPGVLMPLLHVTSAALVFCEWAVYERSPRVAAIAIFLHVSAVGAVLVSGFWSIVNERFDARTARRYIGRIGMGATVGGILGGVVSERTALFVTTDALLLVVVGLQLVAALALRVLAGGRRRSPAPGRRPTAVSAPRLVAASRMLRNLALVVMLGAAAAAVLDYALKSQIAMTPGGPVRALAIYYTATNVITALVQIAIGRAVLGRLGVPRSVATLPAAVAVFSTLAIAVPAMIATAIARGAEAIVRSSVYRSAYELLYAPLPERHKRPAKVVLDTGAERAGDLVGAHLVGAIVYLVAEPRAELLLVAAVIGAIATAFALRLPRGYAEALELSLLSQAPADARPRGEVELPPVPGIRTPTASAGEHPDDLTAQLAELRSGDPRRVRAALVAPLCRELVPSVIGLTAWDEVAPEALAAIEAVAVRCTGVLVDALVDPTQPLAVRRRLPGLVARGEPHLAAWGLRRALGDPHFEIRFRCGQALARLLVVERGLGITTEEVFAAIRREVLIERSRSSATATPGAPPLASPVGIEHLFTLLGLVFPREPLRVAMHAIQTDDPKLRGTAYAYLEALVPSDLRVQLWPVFEPARHVAPERPVASGTHRRARGGARAARSTNEVTDDEHSGRIERRVC